MRWLFVDRIESVTLGESIQGYKGVALSEDYFVDHFPNFPVVPGVIVTEALAQLSGKLIELTVYEEREMWPVPILSMVNKAKFRKFIKPGSLIEMHAKIISLREESAMTRVEARVDGKRTTTAELVFVFNPEGTPDAETVERHERSFIRQIWPGYDAFVQTSRVTTGVSLLENQSS